jgi:hypothetical protein
MPVYPGDNKIVRKSDMLRDGKIVPSIVEKWVSQNLEHRGLPWDYEFPLQEYLEEVVSEETIALYDKYKDGGLISDGNMTMLHRDMLSLTNIQRGVVWIILGNKREFRRKIPVMKRNSPFVRMITDTYVEKSNTPGGRSKASLEASFALDPMGVILPEHFDLGKTPKEILRDIVEVDKERQ